MWRSGGLGDLKRPVCLETPYIPFRLRTVVGIERAIEILEQEFENIEGVKADVSELSDKKLDSSKRSECKA